jgi:hypothetical protein
MLALIPSGFAIVLLLPWSTSTAAYERSLVRR